MSLLDLLFPKNCLECKRPGKYFCDHCLSKMEYTKPICPVCKRYSFQGKTHSFCTTKTSLDGLISFWKYEGVIRKGILALKYRFASDVVKELVETLDLDNLKESEKTVLVPVPLHIKRERWRGFNQSAVLGKLIAEKAGLDFTEELVLKLENTTPQAKLGKTERMRNISGKFAVNANASREAPPAQAGLAKWDRIIVFDDVWTTGSTMAEVCKELKLAGAKDVCGMCVARN